MAADTITVRESTVGNPVAKKTAVHLDLIGSLTNTPLYTPATTDMAALAPAGEHTHDNGPVQAPLTYRMKVDAPAGVDDAYGPKFTPNDDYKWTWDDYVFPAAGSYTIRLLKGADDSVISALNASVTVD